jgi:hypothetical protein
MIDVTAQAFIDGGVHRPVQPMVDLGAHDGAVGRGVIGRAE